MNQRICFVWTRWPDNWYDQCKCDDFLRDTDQHFNREKIINFDIIHRECNGEEVPKDLLKHYQTLNDKAISDYPETELDRILSSAFGTDQTDFNKKIKPKTVLFHKSFF